MALSQYDSPPLLESKEDIREYLLKLHQDVYGLGNDISGSLSFTDNLIDPPNITGTANDTFTIDTDFTGGDISLIFGNQGSLIYDESASEFVLSDCIKINNDMFICTGSITSDSGAIDFNDENLSTTGTLTSGELTLTGDIVMSDNDITGVGDITFTDCSVGTIGGIICENLLDKTATESISGLYTWTANGIHFNDNIPATFGNTSGTPDVLIDYDSGTTALNIDLTGVANTDLDVTTSGGANTFFIDGQNTRVGINTNTPTVALDAMGANEGACFFQSDWTIIPAGLTKNNAAYLMNITESGWLDKIMNGFVSSVVYNGFATDNGATINKISGFLNNINLSTTVDPGGDNHLLTNVTGFESLLNCPNANTRPIEVTEYYGVVNDYNGGSLSQVTGTDWYGFYSGDASDAVFAPINLHGMFIEEQTGGTNNYELWIDGGGEVFFRDPELSIGSLTDGSLDITTDNRATVNGRDILSMALMGVT